MRIVCTYIVVGFSVSVMRKAFQMFDTTKCGFIETLKISTILNTMGQLFDDGELQNLIADTDPEGTTFQPYIFTA
jgi:Ca2+-binding EF-hand superfamily protein